jgi:hypothetical protein
MESNKHPIIANHYFSYVSSECQSLFENGYYYGCISLCQSVAEALARFLYERWTGKDPAKTFGANIQKINSAKVLPEVGKLLEDIYGGQQRQDFHHLNKAVPTDYEQLRAIATEKIKLLNKAESQIFEYKYGNNGGLIVTYEVYWNKEDGKYGVFLRLD